MTYPVRQLVSVSGRPTLPIPASGCRLFPLITVPSISLTNLPSGHLLLLRSFASRVTKAGAPHG